MPPSEPSTMSNVGTAVSDFLLCLVKVIWYILVSIVKVFLPVHKKDVKKELVLVTGAGSGIGRIMAIKFAEMGASVMHYYETCIYIS